MAPRPAVEKLPLAARKSFRDDFDAQKPEWEKELGEIFGVPWTVEINQNELYAYAADNSDSEIKSRPGYTCANYFQGAIGKIKDFKREYGAMGIDEANQLASAHKLTLANDDSTTHSGCDLRDGALRIIFNEAQFGSWYNGALGELAEALDATSAAASGPYSFMARFTVERDYTPHAEEVRKRVAETLAIPDVKLSPRHEENAQVLEKAGVRGWKEDWGRTVMKVMKDAAEGLEKAGFKSDDMLQEGLQEALTGKELAVYMGAEDAKGQWNAVALKEGVIQLQFEPDYYNTTITSNMKALIDLL